MSVDPTSPLRGPWTRRRLSAFISFLKVDIESAEAEIADLNQNLAEISRLTRELERTKEMFSKAPDFLEVEQPDFGAHENKLGEMTASCESLIRGHEEMNKARHKTLAEAEDMLRQMPN